MEGRRLCGYITIDPGLEEVKKSSIQGSTYMGVCSVK